MRRHAPFSRASIAGPTTIALAVLLLTPASAPALTSPQLQAILDVDYPFDFTNELDEHVRTGTVFEIEQVLRLIAANGELEYTGDGTLQGRLAVLVVGHEGLVQEPIVSGSLALEPGSHELADHLPADAVSDVLEALFPGERVVLANFFFSDSVMFPDTVLEASDPAAEVTPGLELQPGQSALVLVLYPEDEPLRPQTLTGPAVFVFESADGGS